MTNRKSRVTFRVALCVLSILGIGTAREVPAQGETTTRLQMPLWAKGGSNSPGAKPDIRVDGALRTIAREFDGWKTARSLQAPAADFRSRHPFAPVGGEYVTIDAVAEGDADVLFDNLTALGLRHGAVSGHLVSGRLPLAALSAWRRCRASRLPGRPISDAARVR